MIIQHTAIPFGGRVTDIKTPSFICVVTTAKEGIFKGLSTMVTEVDQYRNPVPCAKFLYPSSVGKEDRWALHRQIAEFIDNHGEEGNSLGKTVFLMGEFFGQMSIFKKTIYY